MRLCHPGPNTFFQPCPLYVAYIVQLELIFHRLILPALMHSLPLNAPAADSAAMARVMSIAATLDPQRQKAAAAEAQKKLIWGAKSEKVHWHQVNLHPLVRGAERLLLLCCFSFETSRQSSNASSLWNAAEFGDSAEKNKFMKLMGAYKGKNKPAEPAAAAEDSLATSESATSSDAPISSASSQVWKTCPYFCACMDNIPIDLTVSCDFFSFRLPTEC
jgi:hypothetical protein